MASEPYRVERWYGREWSVVSDTPNRPRDFWSLERSEADRLAAALNEWAKTDCNPSDRPLGFVNGRIYTGATYVAVLNALREQVGECFDPECAMCIRHERILSEAEAA